MYKNILNKNLLSNFQSDETSKPKPGFLEQIITSNPSNPSGSKWNIVRNKYKEILRMSKNLNSFNNFDSVNSNNFTQPNCLSSKFN